MKTYLKSPRLSLVLALGALMLALASMWSFFIEDDITETTQEKTARTAQPR